MSAIKKTLLALGSLSLASAFPAGSVNTCVAVSAVVNALHAQSTASSFCTSLLKISTSTITSTSTATLVIPASTTITTGTNTVTASPAIVLATITVPTTQVITSSAVTTITTSVSTSTVTTTSAVATVTLLDCSSPPHAKVKRASKPNALALFVGAELSSACRCLSLPTPSTTQYVTRTATVTTTSTIPVAATATTTPTTTSTIVVQNTITSTATTVSTVNVLGTTFTTTTSTVTATSTPGYCTSNNQNGYINVNGGNPYLNGNTLNSNFPFVATYSLVNGALQEAQDSDYNNIGAFAYVLDGLNGGTVNLANPIPAGATKLQCIVGGNPGSMHPFNCYNKHGMQWSFYTFDSDSSQGLQVGLSIPNKASGKGLGWFG